jgi:hypothetical protein
MDIASLAGAALADVGRQRIAERHATRTAKRPKLTAHRLATVSGVRSICCVATDGGANLGDTALVDLPRRFTSAHRPFNNFV